MQVFRLFSLALVAMLFISSCKDDDDSNGNGCSSQGTFSVTINGTVFTGTSFNNTLLVATSGGVDGKRLDIRATAANGQQLIITTNDLTSGLNGDCVSPSATYVALDDISTGGENTFFITMYSASNVQTMLATEGTLDITSCNESGKTVSGAFSFEGMDNNLDDVSGINGTFTNMCYTVTR